MTTAPVATRPTRWIHALPVVMALFSWVLGPILVGWALYALEDPDPSMGTSVLLGAIVVSVVAMVAFSLISTFVIMLGYAAARPSASSTNRRLQYGGLVFTFAAALVGVALLVWIVANF